MNHMFVQAYTAEETVDSIVVVGNMMTVVVEGIVVAGNTMSCS